jgi:peptidoglycan/LPS O-acetylase OafA/YrhL
VDSSEKAISGFAHQKMKRGSGEKEGFRPDIEGLRGIAVALVVLFHAGLLSQASTQLTGGFIGVDLFFVVSGFLITGLLIRERERDGRISFSRFYARRVRRILPAAAVVLVVTFIAANAIVTLVDRPSVMEDGAAAALSVANIRFALTTDYFNPVSYSPFLHFWSLGVEEQFYFIWPALLAVVAWKFPRPGAAVALTVVLVASFVASLIVTDAAPSSAFYLLPTRAWQLAAGGLLAIGAGSLDRFPGAVRRVFGQLLAFAGWGALAALVTAALVIDSSTMPYPGMAALVPTVAGVLLIASGQERSGPGLLLRLPPVRFLGKISYSLYLWHWPILVLGGFYLNGAADLTLTTGQAIALAGLAVPVAAMSWFFIEEPFRRGRIPLPRPGRLVAVGVAVMLIVAAVGTTFDFGAQSALAGLNGTADASPTAAATDQPTDEPTDQPTPTIVLPTATLTPGVTASPIPAVTPALSPSPNPGPPSSYAVAGLRPSLGKVTKDYEQPWHDGCLGFDPATSPKSGCVYGNTSGKYTVVLLGDSHGSAIFPGVNQVAKAHGWKLVPYLKINCPFTDIRMIEFNRKNEYTECETWNLNVVSKLNKNPPNLLIISESRWFYPVSGNDSAGADGAALARMIKKVPAATRVVILQDPPLPGISDKAPTCLSANQSDYRKCNYSRSRGFSSSMGTREQAAAAATGAGLIDLTATICPGTGSCPIVQNGIIMWRDEQHLTATYATTLGPAIDIQLAAILSSWAAAAASKSP